MAIEKVLYRGHATATGGREGRAVSSDGVLDVKLTTPKENVSTYTFNRHVIQHHFCANCGIAPYGEGSDPKGNRMAAVNLRCIPAIDLETLTINKVDGRSF